MFIKRNRRVVKGKVYEYGFLVNSVSTANGPRHRVAYSLGKLEIDPGRDKQIAADLERMLCGQQTIQKADPIVMEIFARLKPVSSKGRRRAKPDFADEPVILSGEVTARDFDEASKHRLLPEVAVEYEPLTAYSEAITFVDEPPNWLEVHSKFMAFKDAREAGPVYVGHQIWEKLGLSEILARAGLKEGERKLSEILTLNRLIEPASEHATPDWASRTALADLLGEDIAHINYRELYGNLDKLHGQRQGIEQELFAREASLFNLDTTLFLYDLTSTYMEGQCLKNEAAKHGYSRDSRPDCRQVVVGLMLNRDGFPIGHEVFDGNTADCKTVEHMLNEFEMRTGGQQGATVVVDRGMSGEENLGFIRKRGHHYIVAAKQNERQRWLAEFESEEGWREVMRQSVTNGVSRATGVHIKRFERDDEIFILCVSEGRIEKDRAIRKKQEERLIRDLKKLEERVKNGALKTVKKIHEAVGRIKERYPRVSRYYEIDFNEPEQRFIWLENAERKANAEKVDGGYVLRTTRKDLSDDDIWLTYMLLTRVESAFRDMKSPLSMRPIYHHLQHRTEAHIFLCILAYHLLVSIEHLLHNAGINKSWETIRKELSTHQTVSGMFVTKDRRVVEIRRDTITTPAQRCIYQALGIPTQIFSQPRRRWVF